MPTPSRACFQALNIPADAIPESMAAFELYAPARSDLWRVPSGSRDTSTAPVLYTALRHPFVSAEVTVAADWKLEWDQAGLVIFAGAPPGQPATIPPVTVQPVTTTEIPPPSSTAGATETIITSAQSLPTGPPAYTPPTASKWVKVGLEFSNNTCSASSVCATPDGADWCLNSLPPSQAQRGELRVKFERIGYALWIYYEDDSLSEGISPDEPGPTGYRDPRFGALPGRRWKKFREITWFFFGVEDKSVRVGVYASRPASWPSTEGRRRSGDSQADLRVEFDGLQIF